MPLSARSFLRPALAGVLASLAVAAQAGNLSASASQNPLPPDTDVSAGSLAQAQLIIDNQLLAEATVSRVQIAAWVDGAGVPVTALHAASGSARTDYALWNLAADAPLDAATAAGLVLAFDFRVSGSASLPPLSLSTVALSYDAALFSTGFETAGSAVSAAYGPKPPFPSEGYVVTGNAALLAPFDTGFTLTHRQAANGLLTMGLAVQAANAGDAEAVLQIQGVRLVGGALPDGGLAVQLETGERFLVSAVPELPPAALLAAGLLALGLRARRRG